MSNPNVIGGGRMGALERSGDGRRGEVPRQSRLKTLRRIWRYLGRHRGLMLLSFLLAALGNALALVGPKLSGEAIDAIGTGRGQSDFPRVVRLVLAMILICLVSSLINYILSRVMLRVRRKVVTRMRRDVFSRMLSLPVSYFDRHQTGDLLSVITYDIDTVNVSLSSDLIQLLRSFVTVIVSFVMMLTIAPQLVLIFAVTVPATALYTRWATRRARPLFRERSARLGALNGMMEQMMDGQRTTKAYAREEQVIALFDRSNEEAVDAYAKAEYAGTLVFSSVNFINNLSLALVSVFGALLYLGGSAGLGDISAFVQYSRKFSGPINETASIAGELQSAFAAAERVFRLMDALPEPADAPGARTLSGVKGDVRLKDLRFSYLPQVPVIKGLSLHARPGEVVAIVGPTGAGKTTLINLLMRFYDIDSGSITIDGMDIYSLTRDSLRGAFTMVLQDNWLFYGTVHENIAYGCPGASREAVEKAAKAAMIHPFIMSLPEGYDTLIGHSGHAISKGQAQLLTIARAMLRDARMLILDEATSNVDTRTEQRIQQAMLELMRGRTCFVIAHRLSTVRNADHILVVKDALLSEEAATRASWHKTGLCPAVQRAVWGVIKTGKSRGPSLVFIVLLFAELVDVQHILPMELLQPADGRLLAVGDAGAALGHGFQLAFVNAQLRQRLGQAHAAVEDAQTVNRLLHDLLLVTQALGDTHHLHGELDKHVDVVLVDVAHPGGGDHRQPGPVGHVIHGAELMLHVMAAPVFLPAHAHQAVVGHGAGKADLRPGVIVLRVLNDGGAVGHDGVKGGLAQRVGEVHVGGVGEIALKDMAHHVGHAVGDLVFGQGEEQLRVHDGDQRPQVWAAVAILALAFLVGDDGVSAGLAACRGNREDDSHRQRLPDGQPLLINLPDIPLVVHAHGDGLGGVDGAAAAHRQDQVNLFLPAQRDALVHQGQPGVGLDAAQFHKIDARLFQRRSHLVIQPAPLDAAAAVVQQHLLRVRLEELPDLPLGAPPEHHARRGVKLKILHRNPPSLY